MTSNTYQSKQRAEAAQPRSAKLASPPVAATAVGMPQFQGAHGSLARLMEATNAAVTALEARRDSALSGFSRVRSEPVNFENYLRVYGLRLGKNSRLTAQTQQEVMDAIAVFERKYPTASTDVGSLVRTTMALGSSSDTIKPAGVLIKHGIVDINTDDGNGDLLQAIVISDIADTARADEFPRPADTLVARLKVLNVLGNADPFKASRNRHNPNGDSPLRLALLAPRGATLKALIESSVLPREAINTPLDTPLGESLLHVACKAGRVDSALVLLEAGARVGAVDNAGTHCLHIAAYKADLAMLGVLLTYLREDEIDALNVRQAQGYTALEIAVTKPSTDAVALLLGAGARADLARTDGLTPLHLGACVDGASDILGMLVGHGAAVEAASREGDTPLHWAAAKGAPIDNLTKLAELGANINARRPVNTPLAGYTPLHAAAQHTPGLAIIRTLIAMGARIDAMDAELRLPLHYAAIKTADPRVIACLAGGDVDINSRDKHGMNALDIAMQSNLSAEVSEALIACGAVKTPAKAVNAAPSAKPAELIKPSMF